MAPTLPIVLPCSPLPSEHSILDRWAYTVVRFPPWSRMTTFPYPDSHPVRGLPCIRALTGVPFGADIKTGVGDLGLEYRVDPCAESAGYRPLNGPCQPSPSIVHGWGFPGCFFSASFLFSASRRFILAWSSFELSVLPAEPCRVLCPCAPWQGWCSSHLPPFELLCLLPEFIAVNSRLAF